MADDRPMAEQLQAPTGGFESAIVVPIINAQNFELKSSLINLVQNRIFRGGNDEEPHAHIRHFESITNNQRYPDVPNTTIKLLLFPFSLDGVAKTWLGRPMTIPTLSMLLESQALSIKTPPMNQEYYNSHSSGFDQFQPHQFSDVYQTPPVASMEMLHAQTDLIEAMQNFLKKYEHIPHNEKSIKLLLAEEKFLKIKQVVEEEQTQPEYLQELLQSLLKDLQILNQIQPLKQEISNLIQKDQEEKSTVELLVEERLQKANQVLNEKCNLFDIDDSYYEKSTSRLAHLAPFSPKIVEVCVNDDSVPLGDIIALSKAVTPDLPIEEPDNFLKSEGLSDNESECDMPVCDVSSPIFTVFSNPLFDSNDNFSSDDESLSEEEIQKDEFNSFSNPLYDIDDEIITNESNLLSKKDLDEIILIPPGIDEPCFNAESDLLESLLNRDSPIDSTKTDSIFDEFSFPRLPEEHNSENVDTIIESLSYSPIPVEDSDSLIEEIDLFLTSDDSMPPGIESDDYDSEGDFRFLEELLINDSLPLPENESYNLDSFDNPESPVVKSCFDFEPVAAVTNDFDVLNNDESFDSGEGENVDSLNVEEEDSFTFTIRSFLPFVTYPEVLPASYSTGSEDKVFKPGICDNVLTRKSSLTLDVFDPLHPPLMDFHVTKAFSKKFFEPGIKNATVFRILEDSWFKFVEGQSNAYNFH
ncbi:hypothetical protein Tco_0392871 [Tanacetum coccineum]